MKKIFIILLLQTIITCSFSQQLNFGNYLTISSGADGYGRARIVTVSNGDPLIVWRKDSSPKMLKATDGLVLALLAHMTSLMQVLILTLGMDLKLLQKEIQSM